MDRGAWQATVHGDAESDMTEQLALERIRSVRMEKYKSSTNVTLQNLKYIYIIRPKRTRMN